MYINLEEDSDKRLNWYLEHVKPNPEEFKYPNCGGVKLLPKGDLVQVLLVNNGAFLILAVIARQRDLTRYCEGLYGRPAWIGTFTWEAVLEVEPSLIKLKEGV